MLTFHCQYSFPQEFEFNSQFVNRDLGIDQFFRDGTIFFGNYNGAGLQDLQVGNPQLNPRFQLYDPRPFECADIIEIVQCALDQVEIVAERCGIGRIHWPLLISLELFDFGNLSKGHERLDDFVEFAILVLLLTNSDKSVVTNGILIGSFP